jgi:hypothetical protein
VAGPTHSAAIADAHQKYLEAQLDRLIALKKEERDHLASLLTPQEYLQDIWGVVNATFVSLSAALQRPVINDKGEFTAWQADPAASECKNRLLLDLSAFCSRVIVIEQSKGQAVKAKADQKHKLKETADNAMQVDDDGKAEAQRIQRIVDHQVAASLKKLSLGNGKGNGTLFSNSIENSPSYPLRRKRPAEETDSQDDCEEQSPPFWETPENLEESPQRPQKGARPREWRTNGRIFEQSTRERQREEINLAMRNVRYENPDTYPDLLLTIPPPLAVKALLAIAPPEILRAAKIFHDVHIGPGVVMDPLLRQSLGVGLRYLLFKPYDENLIIHAYDDFCERLRWKVYFMKELALQGSEEIPDEYDPDYDLHKPRTKEAELMEPYIEEGLHEGKKFVEQHVSHFRSSAELFKPYKSQRLQLAKLNGILNACNYMVTITDKNLGAAIITRQWFIEGSKNCLSDAENYETISPAERQYILEETVADVRTLSELAEKAGMTEQLCKFLTSKCPEDETREPAVPRFYGIPKIHKQPVKFRPIVPCHSCVQAPAAKFVSKTLKPLISARRKVLKGTKQLAADLKNYKISAHRKKFLVSADIVAFYPSLPLEKTIDLMIQIFDMTYPNMDASIKDVFNRAIRLANFNLLCEFDGVTYRQKKGIAMGVACSPDIANLWGAYFEDLCFQNDPILRERVAFYRRFIDDIFMVVYADNAAEALQIAQRLSLDDPGCDDIKLTWEVSEYHLAFLDMMVYIDPHSGRIEHTPYMKRLNHLERVPWISHHPKDIKKGTFIGEMSRLATLNSTHDGYAESIYDLKLLYIKRGYPTNLLEVWIKDNFQKRWNTRLSNLSAGSADVFVHKTEFNPAWMLFNVQKLGETITESWRSHLHKLYDRQIDSAKRNGDPVEPWVCPRASPRPKDWIRLFLDGMTFDVIRTGLPDRRFLVSRKRTSNLFDLTNTWKKVILSDTFLTDDDHITQALLDFEA